MFVIVSSLLLVFLLTPSSANQYDPHLYPRSGPFFEGWYFRFIDFDNKRSFGSLFGTVLPQDATKVQRPAYIGLLKNLREDRTLKDLNCFPDINDVSVTVGDGEAVTKDPNYKSPASFVWSAGASGCGSVEVKPDSASVNVTFGNVHFEAQIGAPVAWDAAGSGPMGRLGWVPFIPLSWFVYSLGSPVLEYKWLDLDSGQAYTGRGFVHMEKNWGNSFPEGWIWTQGMSSDGQASFAGTYGPVGFGPVSVPGHLVGYRNNNKGISIDFRPDNSIISISYDGCQGYTNMTLKSVTRKVEINIWTSPSTYSNCLYGPMYNGFRKACQESFVAHAQIVVSKMSWFNWKVIDSQQMDFAALEFGGVFSCNQTCLPTD